jgi:hypothetical protein
MRRAGIASEQPVQFLNADYDSRRVLRGRDDICVGVTENGKLCRDFGDYVGKGDGPQAGRAEAVVGNEGLDPQAP